MNKQTISKQETRKAYVAARIDTKLRDAMLKWAEDRKLPISWVCERVLEIDKPLFLEHRPLQSGNEAAERATEPVMMMELLTCPGIRPPVVERQLRRTAFPAISAAAGTATRSETIVSLYDEAYADDIEEVEA